MDHKEQYRILVVDDMDSWRELITVVLRDEGYEVFNASTLKGAKDLLNKERFDLAILDMRLVDESIENVQGLAVLKEAKKVQPSIKAIMYTGYPDQDQKEKALNYYQANDFVEKVPEGQALDIDKFCEKVTTLLHHNQG
jgi:DNA-binding NtrC family response regulator